MKRDTLKTIVGLVLIGAIVVATFMYGNVQRQAQLKKDSKKTTPTASASPQVATSPSQTATTGGSGNNTAPVNSPASNNLQGGGTPAPTGVPVAKSPAQNGQVAGASTVPATGGSGAANAGSAAQGNNLPDTGAPAMGLVGLAAMILAFLWLKRSQTSVITAQRTRR